MRRESIRRNSRRRGIFVIAILLLIDALDGSLQLLGRTEQH
jgi:hypothetical protein